MEVLKVLVEEVVLVAEEEADDTGSGGGGGIGLLAEVPYTGGADTADDKRGED
jgi:hypothetical protein